VKKWLGRFFQLLCLFHIIGLGQLNARPSTEYREYPLSFHVRDTTHVSILHFELDHKVKEYPSMTQKKGEFVTENTEEDDHEEVSSKKQQYSAAVSRIPLPEIVDNDFRISIAYCRQLSFIPVTRRHVVFRVFRI